MTTLVLLFALLGNPDAAARADVLQMHFDRLQAIPVPGELQTEKDARLAPLAGRLEAGLDTGEAVNQLYLDMDEARQWLWIHAEPGPEAAPGAFSETDAAWSIENPSLRVEVNREDLAMTVSTPAQTWRFKPCGRDDIQTPSGALSLLEARARKAEGFKTGYSTGMLITLRDYPDFRGQHFILGLHLVGNELHCTVTAPGDDLVFEMLQWPKAIETGATPDTLSVIPMMQGMLLTGDYPQAIHRRELVNSRTMYMPWFGQIVSGHGVLTILDTSDDAGAAYDHPSGGPTTVRPVWYSSMRKLRYPRKLIMVFGEDQTYVTQAKRYRQYVEEQGRLVTLEEKRARNPRLESVIATPVVHIGALYHNVQESNYYNKEQLEKNHALQTFDKLAADLRQLREKGIERAYVHLDGWGFYGYDSGHPDHVPAGYEQGGWDGLRRFADTCDELGWVFAVHDQYRDFYFNAVSFDDRLALTHPDGSRDEHAVWCGGPQTILSAVWAPGYVRRNHDRFIEHGVKVKGAYLDVFAIVPLEESYQEAHPMTRTECAQYRAEAFNLLRARGYVISSEEPVDRFVPILDLVHHGPYFVFNDEKRSGIPVPLFNLVYHDSILLPWSMGDGGGWGVPEGDAGRLHCMLNAGLPYVSPGDGPEQIARVHEALELARRCGTLEMTNHEFLDETRRKQRSTFADGTTVTVDFDAATCEVAHATRTAQ